MADLIEKQCKTCSHWLGTICEYRPWPTGEACADWEEGKPTSDLINRQTAINTLLKAYPLIQKEKLVEVVNGIPSAQPHWIPCSARLPEKKQSLLVTVADEVSPYTSDDEWTGTGFWAYGKRVSAWMPLPKPYGGESND